MYLSYFLTLHPIKSLAAAKILNQYYQSCLQNSSKLIQTSGTYYINIVQLVDITRAPLKSVNKGHCIVSPISRHDCSLLELVVKAATTTTTCIIAPRGFLLSPTWMTWKHPGILTPTDPQVHLFHIFSHLWVKESMKQLDAGKGTTPCSVALRHLNSNASSHIRTCACVESCK